MKLTNAHSSGSLHRRVRRMLIQCIAIVVLLSTSVGLGSGGSFTWTRFSARSVDRRPLTGLPVSAATAAFAAARRAASLWGAGSGGFTLEAA